MTLKQQIALALLQDPKSWMAEFNTLEDAAKYCEEEKTPKTTHEAIKLSHRAIAFQLASLTDEIYAMIKE